MKPDATDGPETGSDPELDSDFELHPETWSRVERLRHENRIWRVGAGVLLVALFATVYMQNQCQRCRLVLSGQSLNVVDRAGQVRGQLGVNQFGTGLLKLSDEQSRDLLNLEALVDGSNYLQLSEASHLRVHAGVQAGQWAGFELLDDLGDQSHGAMVLKGDQTELYLEGRARAYIRDEEARLADGVEETPPAHESEAFPEGIEKPRPRPIPALGTWSSR